MDIIKSIEHEQLKNKIPELKVGDTVKVHQKIDKWRREKSLENTFKKRPELLEKANLTEEDKKYLENL